MKKMKKTLSLILAVIMILTAVPMQSFALFDDFYPTVEKIEIIDNIPISNKYVQNNALYMGDTIVTSIIYGMDGSYNYDYRIYLSNGKVIETKDSYYEESKPLLNRITDCSVVLSVNPEDCAKAIAEGKSTVGVEAFVVVNYTNDSVKMFSFELEKAIVPEIVKEVRLADTMPENFDKDFPENDFVGKKFEVEYADGRKETHILEKKDGDFNYCLGTEPVSLWYGEDCYNDAVTGEKIYYKGLDIIYIDDVSAIERELLPCPYEKIEVLDTEFNGKGRMMSLTYKITYKDARTLEKTCTFEDGIGYENFAVIDTVDGYDITVYFYTTEIFSVVDVYLGCDIWEIGYHSMIDAKDCCDCICHEDSGIRYIIGTILCRIWRIFRIREYCQCGYWHW